MNRARTGLAVLLVATYLLCGVGHLVAQPTAHAHHDHGAHGTAYQDHFLQMTSVLVEQMSLLFTLLCITFLFVSIVVLLHVRVVSYRLPRPTRSHGPPFQFLLLHTIQSPPVR